jgi:type IV fimbrial biogenesis protein FimT
MDGGMRLRYRQQGGFTLPELLVTLTVASTLTVAATNSLTWLIQENRMVADINRFVTVLHLARSEAVKQGSRIVLCPSADGEHCGNSSEWNSGWMLFQSDDRERDSEEPLIQRGSSLQAGIALHASNHRKRIVYQQDGSSGGTNSSFTFCDSRGKAKPRVICLSNTGRPRLARTRCNRKPIDCSTLI